MQSIEKGAKLKKAETVDKSGPKVEQVKIKKVDRKDLLKEIEGEPGEKKLKHAETVDKSAPTIEAVKVKKIDRKGMLESIEKGELQLKHTEVLMHCTKSPFSLSLTWSLQTVDKSSPKISRKKVDPSSVLADIAKGETKLKHTETVDKSSPVVESMSIINAYSIPFYSIALTDSCPRGEGEEGGPSGSAARHRGRRRPPHHIRHSWRFRPRHRG